MSSLFEQISTVAFDSNVLGTLQGDLAGVAGQATGMPTESINQLLSIAGQIVLPEQNDLFGDSAGSLASLVGSGLRQPDELWAKIIDPFTNLEGAMNSALSGNMSDAFSSLQDIGDGLPADPEQLLSGLVEPLQQVIVTVTASPDTQRLNDFIRTIRQQLDQFPGTPAEFSALIAEQINNAITGLTSGVDPVTRQLQGFITHMESSLQLEALTNRMTEAHNRLTRMGEQQMSAAVAALDLSSEAAVAVIQGQLTSGRGLLEDLSVDVERSIAPVLAGLDVFQVEAWARRLAAEADQASQATINEIDTLFAGWLNSLTQAEALVSGLSFDQTLGSVRQITSTIEQQLSAFDLQSTRDSITRGLGAVKEVVSTVQDAQTQVLAGLQSTVGSITGVIDGVNLDSVTNTITNGINQVNPVLTQAESLIDTISTEMENALTSLENELTSIHTTLTDPTSTIRTTISDFYTAIDDLVPDNIPQTLEDTSTKIAEAVEKLDGIAFDPVFDTVVEELDDMKQQLGEIYAASLNALLKAALAAALQVFKQFDFTGEVEEFLTEKYDKAVEELTDPAIDLLQKQVDKIVDFMEKNGPTMLFETLGIGDAYEQMVAELESFKPSKVLDGVTDKVQTIADLLEEYTPSRIMGPILEPVEQLEQFIDSLSLDPLFAGLDQAVTRLTASLTEFDISGFISQITSAINRLKNQINNVLTTSGLLDSYRPVHQAVMSGVEVLDPDTVLKPVNDIRQALLNGIDSLDVSALTTALQSIRTSVDSYRLPDLRSRYQSTLDQLSSGMSGFDLPGKMTSLRREWQAVKSSLDGLGVQTDAVAEQHRQRLLATVEASDPLQILAVGVERFGDMETALSTFTTGVGTALAGGTPLETSLIGLGTRLQEVAGVVTEEGGDLKESLRQLVNRTYQNLGADRITSIYTSLTATLSSYSPENLESALDEALAPVRNFLDTLLDPTEVFAGVVTLFNEVKALITPGLNTLLTQLRQELEPILDSLNTAIEAFNPRAILTQLDTVYTDIVALKDRLLAKFNQLLNSLDTPYEQVLSILEDMNPSTVLVKPLEATYQAIVAKFADINIRKVFQPLLDAIAFLRDELIKGIKRTGKSFEAFLGAAPAGVAGVSL